MKKAVFLDRDGVINPPVFNPYSGEYESPHKVEDFVLYPWTIDSLEELKKNGYLLFLVSNQPSYAKGKTSLENIKAIHEKFRTYINKEIVDFTDYYYCYHHPEGVVPEFSYICKCRKPKPYFLLQAKEKYRLNMSESLFIGDRDSDIFCGQNAGVRTILILEEHSKAKRGKSKPDFVADNLAEAVEIIGKSLS